MCPATNHLSSPLASHPCTSGSNAAFIEAGIEANMIAVAVFEKITRLTTQSATYKLAHVMQESLIR